MGGLAFGSGLWRPEGQGRVSLRQERCFHKEIIIMYIYHALINALSAHMIHINLNMIFYTHVKHSPTKTIYIKYCLGSKYLTPYLERFSLAHFRSVSARPENHQ